MKKNVIKKIMQEMLKELNNYQLEKLQNALEKFIIPNRQEEKTFKDYKKDNSKLLEDFLSAKKLEGCSTRTIVYYQKTINSMFLSIGKDVKQIVTDDLRLYLSKSHGKNNSSNITIDNIRRILSSFFAWLEDEDIIMKSPVRRIHKLKTEKLVKETYSDEQIEIMRDSCKNVRDLVVIEMLASSGMRIGELVKLNREDINFQEREGVALGKGNKERTVYFDARTKLHLEHYLLNRKDSESALFVSIRKPFRRVSIGGLEVMLRKKGNELSIGRVHPHKFRRTLATVAIDKGMPIEQLQKLLGHERIDTTLHYAMVKESNIKLSHKRYIG